MDIDTVLRATTSIISIPDTRTSSMDIDAVLRATTGIIPMPDMRTPSTDIDPVSGATTSIIRFACHGKYNFVVANQKG